MLPRLLLGKAKGGATATATASATYALQPKTTTTISSSIGGGGGDGGGGFFFSTSLLRASSTDSPLLTNFFRSHGFREEDINVILRKIPRLRNANIQNTLRPKLDFLVSSSTNLTGADISEILVANPHILRYSVERVTSHINFLKAILPSKDDLIRVLKKSNLGTKIGSNVEFLKNRGVAGAQIRNMLISQPNALSRRKDEFLAAVGHVEDLGLSPDDGSRYVQALGVMSYMSRSTILRKVELFKKLGWSDDQAAELIRKFAKAMTLSEDNIRKKLEFFREKVGWSEEQVVETIRKYPMVFGQSEDNIKKKMDFFREKVGWSEDQVVEVIRKYPRILGHSGDNIGKKVEFFSDKVGLSKKQVVQVIRKYPAVLNRSEDTITKKMEFLREKVGWSEEQVVEVIRKYPTVFGLSEDNISKKVEFLREKVGLGTDCLYRNPELLGGSLEKRFLPRFAVLNILVSRGLLKKFVGSLHWLRCTDKYFFDHYVRRYKGKLPDVSDASLGQMGFLGWNWLKDDDDNNQQHKKIPSSQAPCLLISSSMGHESKDAS